MQEDINSGTSIGRHLWNICHNYIHHMMVGLSKLRLLFNNKSVFHITLRVHKLCKLCHLSFFKINFLTESVW